MTKKNEHADLMRQTPRVQRSLQTQALEEAEKTIQDSGRRVKIETEHGVRELTHKELILLLARRASVESDVVAGRKPKYKKCSAASCILLIPIRNRGQRKWCSTHKLEKRREKDRAYREKHLEKRREKERERNRAYCEANREKHRERVRAYREANLEKCRERERAYREANLEKCRERERVRREKHRERNRAYREANREKERERERAYYVANREKINAGRRFARALKKTREEIASGKRKGLTQQEIEAEIQAVRKAKK